MGKKVKAAMHAQREKFVAGCVAQGYTPEVGANLFDTIEPFAGYGFDPLTPPATATSPIRPPGSKPITPPSTWRRC